MSKTTERFIKLARTDSPSGSEEAVRNMLLREFGCLGCKGEVDDAGNLKFFLPGTRKAPVRLFCAHMDTVEPGRGVKPRVSPDGVITSGGATILGADDKDGITAIWCALDRLVEGRHSHPPLEILFTVEEEANLGGSRRIKPGWLKAKAGWVFDGPGRPGTIYCNGVAKTGFRITVKGRAAHSAICPEEGRDALAAAAAAIGAFPPGRHNETTINYGTVRGGAADNIVPEHITLAGEIRSQNPKAIRAAEKSLRETWRGALERRGCSFGFKRVSGYPAYALSHDSAHVKMTARTLEKLGLRGEIAEFKAASDANHLGGLGVDVCLLATGRKGNHTVSETTTSANLQVMTEVAFALMRA